jgi:hypothetical protein
MGLVRKLLFVLQTEWYSPEMVPTVVETLKVAAQSHFGAEEAIKPILTYLAANLQEGTYFFYGMYAECFSFFLIFR